MKHYRAPLASLLYSSPGQGSFLDLINTSYEPFIALLAAAGAVASFFLFQAINNAGRRRRRRDIEGDSVGLLYGELNYLELHVNV